MYIDPLSNMVVWLSFFVCTYRVKPLGFKPMFREYRMVYFDQKFLFSWLGRMTVKGGIWLTTFIYSVNIFLCFRNCFFSFDSFSVLKQNIMLLYLINSFYKYNLFSFKHVFFIYMAIVIDIPISYAYKVYIFSWHSIYRSVTLDLLSFPLTLPI